MSDRRSNQQVDYTANVQYFEASANSTTPWTNSSQYWVVVLGYDLSTLVSDIGTTPGTYTITVTNKAGVIIDALILRFVGAGTSYPEFLSQKRFLIPPGASFAFSLNTHAYSFQAVQGILTDILRFLQ